MSICKLNKEQLQAVKYKNGPLLIIAGAGTGKTTVITERIKYLITKGLAKPEEILALTFTEKAAMEMETRVDEAMPLSYGDIFITTFHSFCDLVLRDEAIQIGLPGNFKLMTKEKSIDFFKKNLFNFSLDYFRPLGNPNKFIDSILSHFSRLQDEVITTTDYLNWTKKLKKSNNEEEKLENSKWEELALVYKEYEEIKLKEGKFDFGDLIIKTVELFKKRPNILKKYQERFRYILVDEFQDTNFAQNELANLLANRYKNITVVGDDNQSIYRFRGAAVSNILQFKKTYPKTKVITLNKNYRSSQNILDGAYKLIKNNDPDTLEKRLGISKKLISVKKTTKNNTVEFIHTTNGDEEVEKVSKEIKKLIDKNKYLYKDIAVLVRANNHADSFIREFERKGIPHQFLGPSKLFEREEIVDLISYLKSLYNPEDTESFYRLISSSFLNIESLELIRAVTNAKRKSTSIYEVIVGNKKFEKPINVFNKHLRQLNIKSAGQILYEYLEEVGIYGEIVKNEDDVKAKNISNFFEKIKSFENENPKARFREVVDYINLISETGESPTISTEDWQNENVVNILTVHSSKGLEFPVVFLVNLVSDRFPSRERSEQISIPDELIKEELPLGDFHLQEERRLFYVGMTRAKEKLYFTASDYYLEAKRVKKISPFVFEALGEIDKYTQKIKNTLNLDYEIDGKIKETKKKSFLKINYLSVSQIETFKTCPLHYKLRYIYQLVTPPSASVSFGISIHNTLKEFFELKKRILNIYKNNWIEEGYLNKKHKQEFYKKGESYLLGFLKNGHNKKIKTIALEQKFIMSIDKTLKIGGVIDRVDELKEHQFEVVDYKTGANIPTQKEVDKDLQLSVYALAVSNLYKVKPENIKLSLYFLDTQEKITTQRTEKDLEKVKEEILKIRDEIEKSDFKCSKGYFCQNKCEYSMFCKVTK